MKFSSKKAQGLPLNTIVIAMLVIIVLLIIIVFFTKGMGDTGETIDKNSASICSAQNSVISTMGYLHAEYSTSSDYENSCAHPDFEVIGVIPKNKKEFEFCGQTIKVGAVCCGTKKTNTWTCEN